MPFALLIVGIMLVVAGVRNKQDTLFQLVKGDFQGQGNFIYWVVSIMMIGAIGYIPKLKPLSTGFLALIVVVLFLTRGGFFDKFNAALQTTTGSSPVANDLIALPLQPLADLAPLGGIQ